jgi:phosphotriesterase-related protein
MPKLMTTLGPLDADMAGMILPHEHIYVDMQANQRPTDFAVPAADVIALMAPEVLKARSAGVDTLVDCTPVGVGRRVDLVKAVSEATGLPIVAPTGIYREPWIPRWAHEATEATLRDWMLGELTGQIGETGVQAGWIKLSAGDDGLTPCETKVLRAAAQAGAQTGAVIGSHTIRGRVALEQMGIIEAQGHSARRFIWIHTQSEPDFALHLEVARRGAWIEYDAIGSGPSDAVYIERILGVLEAGLGDHLLLSQDRGWYDPQQPKGGAPRPFTYISEVFLPKLIAAGVAQATVKDLVERNPYRAFAR